MDWTHYYRDTVDAVSLRPIAHNFLCNVLSNFSCLLFLSLCLIMYLVLLFNIKSGIQYGEWSDLLENFLRFSAKNVIARYC